jgi:hypothetical protein
LKEACNIEEQSCTKLSSYQQKVSNESVAINIVSHLLKWRHHIVERQGKWGVSIGAA